MKKSLLSIAAGALFSLGLVPASFAAPITTPYGFTRITSPASGYSDVASQLSVKVISDATPNVVDTDEYVHFQFFNDVGLDSSLTDIYFDDGWLVSISSITNPSGVHFDDPITGGENFPGGNNLAVPFITTKNFSADSTNPGKGVDLTTESVTITFKLVAGKSYQNTITALATAALPQVNGADDPNDNSLRIGLHVTSEGANSYSDSFINRGEPGTGGNAAVPLPSVALGIPAFLGLALAGRFPRRNRNRAGA